MKKDLKNSRKSFEILIGVWGDMIYLLISFKRDCPELNSKIFPDFLPNRQSIDIFQERLPRIEQEKIPNFLPNRQSIDIFQEELPRINIKSFSQIFSPIGNLLISFKRDCPELNSTIFSDFFSNRHLGQFIY